jgi:hypothetical protein
MATTSGKILTSGQTISTSAGSVGTIDSSLSRFLISDFVIINTGTSIRTVNIYVLQVGDTVVDSNKILVDKVLAGKETYLSFEMIGLSIEGGGSIQAVVDAGTDVSISIIGTEFDK